MSNFEDLTGKKFGRLTCKTRIPGTKNKPAKWVCQCSCGGVTETTANKIKSGYTRSCGCLVGETTKERKTTHGKTRTRTYRIWAGMKNRCNNINEPSYKYYGEKGISVCDRWNTFENFISDMGEVPDKMSIERIDVDGNYEPGNCVWADMITQANNKDRVPKIEYNGKSLSAAQWSKITGIKSGTIRHRIKTGFSPGQALGYESHPKRTNINRRRMITFNGVTKSMQEWAADIGVKTSTLKARINDRKMPLNKALSKNLEI